MKADDEFPEDELTPEEQEIEDAINQGEYVPVSKDEFKRIKAILDAARKDAVLNMRINSGVLKRLKSKAKKMGVKYQTFIAEVLRRVAYEDK